MLDSSDRRRRVRGGMSIVFGVMGFLGIVLSVAMALLHLDNEALSPRSYRLLSHGIRKRER